MTVCGMADRQTIWGMTDGVGHDRQTIWGMTDGVGHDRQTQWCQTTVEEWVSWPLEKRKGKPLESELQAGVQGARSPGLVFRR